MRSLRVAAWALPLVLVLSGCVSIDDDEGLAQEAPVAVEAEAETAPEPEAEPEDPKADPSAKMACRHFRNVVGDIQTLTNDELRGKLREVDNSAKLSENDGIPEGARGMLIAATADDGEAFMQSMGQMSSACRGLGF